MPETPYTETEALIHAMNDYDAGSGNIDDTLNYLTENMTPGEIRRLSGAAMLLSRACSEARGAIATSHSPGYAPEHDSPSAPNSLEAQS